MRRQMLRLTIATLLGLSGAVVSVPALPVHAATLVSIAVTPANTSLDQGLDLQFKATGTFSDGTTADLTLASSWGSSALGVATISATGLAHAVSPGPTNITATNSSVTGSTGLNVYTCGPTPSLSGPAPCGEQFASTTTPFPPGFGGSATVISKTCGPDGTGTLTFTADGNAAGPYPGTFHEDGTIVLAATNVMTADATFTITSAIGNVTGTKSLSGTGSAGNCNFEPASIDPNRFLNFSSQQQQTYQATITNALGRFSDTGTGGSTFSTSFQGVTLVPQFVNAFTEVFQISNGVLGSPTITTVATSANLGGTISDTATLALGKAPTGTINFNIFDSTSPDCTTPLITLPVTVNGNGPYTAFFPAFQLGTFHWVASYVGDANNVAVATACIDPAEISIVTLPTPTITTVATPSAHTPGPITDTATLAGGNAPSGTITFSVFNNSTCTGTAVGTSTKTVSGDGVYPSDPIAAAMPGTYFWVAAYSGDANNNPAMTKCGDSGESSVVTKTTPTITSSATPSPDARGRISDSATLSGATAGAGGNVMFSLFDPTNPTCTGDPKAQSILPVNGSGSYASTPVMVTLPGTYRWIAFYTGDLDNNAATTACGDAGEISIVKATPIVSTLATGPNPIGSAVSDTATLLGGIAPTGTITFSLFGTTDCSGTALFNSTAPVDATGNAFSRPFTPLVAGTYRWLAVYGGDPNNNGGTSLCTDATEVSVVTRANPTISTSATASALTGGNIRDTATLAGGFAPTGSITFSLYGPADTTCAAPLTLVAATVNGNGSYP
ncbi:MAG TPA: Ig-like domain-containing protein, partial [Candidatus Dormibacteraeota bacterium]|nr:Ig-like domain-containing protein [Candidatus Dormibacteraeota bacterium]